MNRAGIAASFYWFGAACIVAGAGIAFGVAGILIAAGVMISVFPIIQGAA